MLLQSRQSQFRRNLRRVIVLPIALLLLLSGVSIGQITRLLSALQWVEHTNEVIAQVNQTQKLLLDMETGFRGYLLVGQQEFLEPYERANTQLDTQLDQLSQLRSCTSVSKGLPKKEKSERKGVIKIQLNGYGNHCSTRPRISV
ncbi:MAG TPA: CHASE3 domain-containing protein [Leptolyngbyaceae cyanobacterium M33_DOE_097]|nr:CHASE3 domain-containing protein [Leptolyngbyaceae cyanobacterium M33_DOE_097]